MNKKNAQSSIEFVIIFSAFLFSFIVFLYIISINISDKNTDKERTLAQNIALDVQYEINTAAQSSTGYYRNFSVPNNVIGKEYAINITDNRVFVVMDKFAVSYKVFPVNGSIRKGSNSIKNKNGVVYLN